MAPSRQPRAAVLAAATFVAAIFGVGAAQAGAKPQRPRAPVSRTGRAAPPFTELVKAARKNDRGALERLASRMGVARLAEGARAADASIAQASLAAIPLARGGVLLASTVAERLEATDAAVAVAAARALGTLLDGDSASELGDWEVPPDVVTRACGGLRALVARPDAPLPSRLAAIDAVATAQSTCGGGNELVALMRDPMPAVRRAAALALRPTDAAATAALRAGLADPDRSVASASVASVCRRLDLAPARRNGETFTDQALAGARALIVAPATPPEDAVEMVACVVASGTPADRALLDKLRQGPPSPLRARALELTGLAGAGGNGKPE
jgi:hypothetical protein